MDCAGLLSKGVNETYTIAAICWGILALIALIIVLFVSVTIDRRSKAAADEAIGRLLGRIWIELRLCILFLAVCVYLAVIFDTDEMVGYIFLISTAWFWLSCIAADLRVNGLRTFSCNCIASIIKSIRWRSARLPLHKAMARRGRAYGIPALLCGAMAFFLFVISINTYDAIWSFLFLIAAGYLCVGAIAFIALYFRTRNEDYDDIARLMERICEIREGRANAPFSLPPGHRFFPYAIALESIYAGIETAVAERTRANGQRSK